MIKLKGAAWLLFVGSLWGLSEVIAGEFLYSKEIPFASVWLSGVALFLLSAGRALVNRPGSSTIVGGLACLYRFVNAGPFLCHLLGIFILGLAFDLAASILRTRLTRKKGRLSLVGVAAAYGNNILFAFIITYVVQYQFWVSGGQAKVLHYIFLSGSLTALLAIVLVPAGFRIGRPRESFFLWQPNWSPAAVLLATLFLWLAGWISG